MRHSWFLDHNTSSSARLNTPDTPFGVSTPIVNVGLDLKNVHRVVAMGFLLQALNPDIAVQLRIVKIRLLDF